MTLIIYKVLVGVRVKHRREQHCPLLVPLRTWILFCSVVIFFHCSSFTFFYCWVILNRNSVTLLTCFILKLLSALWLLRQLCRQFHWIRRDIQRWHISCHPSGLHSSILLHLLVRKSSPFLVLPVLSECFSIRFLFPIHIEQLFVFDTVLFVQINKL